MEIPLCLNDVDLFFIGVIIHPFIKFFLGLVFTSIVSFFIATIASRYTIFIIEKETCIHQLENVLLSGNVKNFKIFRPKHSLNDILKIEGQINRIMTKMKYYNGIDGILGMGPKPLFFFNPIFKNILKYYEKDTTKETIFKTTWESEYPNDKQQMRYKYWPVELVKATLELTTILDKNIKPVWGWILTGIKCKDRSKNK